MRRLKIKRLPPYVLLVVIILVSSLARAAGGHTQLFLARYEIKITDGAIVDTRLIMVPVNTEYRMRGFELLETSGRSAFNSEVGTQSAAQHNALSSLLVKHGLRSVRSRTDLANVTAHDEITLCYEGVLRRPFKLIHQGYLEDRATFNIEMQVWFSPLAFPSEWPYLYKKRMLLDKLQDFISFFR